MNVLLALIKREILEHKSIWKVPAILLAIGLLLKLSMLMGNLSFNLDTPDFLQLDSSIDGAVNKVVIQALGIMNALVSYVMLLVSIFYTLSCLYQERQDESVLFWRSLPISDGMTITSKLLVALILVPLVILVCQILMTLVFLGLDSGEQLSASLSYFVNNMFHNVAWVMLPVISWCLLCSAVAKKNPFLLAFVAPIILIVVEELFFDIGITGLITGRFGISRASYDPVTLLVTGIVFSCVCVFIATFKRSQRI